MWLGRNAVDVRALKSLPCSGPLDSTFFGAYRAVKPFLFPEKEAERGEHIQTPAQRSRFDDPTKCILCAACYSACPVVTRGAPWLGPAAIVQAARFVFDSRDRGIEPRFTF
jgi:succinate dehydrogenase / fumarate reductase iron-sulfur subunit